MDNLLKKVAIIASNQLILEIGKRQNYIKE
jgi:hypothetical protein